MYWETSWNASAIENVRNKSQNMRGGRNKVTKEKTHLILPLVVIMVR